MIVGEDEFMESNELGSEVVVDLVGVGRLTIYGEHDVGDSER